MGENVCWGIEVGSGAVKAIKLEMRGDQPVITDYAIIPHTLPLSAPGVNADDAMRVAIGAFASQVDLRKAKVAVSVPGDAALARFAKLPPVEPKKVAEIVKFEAQQQIPFPLAEVEWDYQTFQSPDSPEIEVGIFAIPKARLNLHLQMLADVGVEPDVINLSPVASYNALAYDLQFTESTEGTVILDIGTASTDIIVAESGRVWVRTFRMGGHMLTEALVSQFSLPYNKAERLKREADQTEHAAKVVRAMRAGLTELAQEIQRSIGSYQAKRPEAKLTRIIGLGATFQLPGLRKFLKQQAGLEVFRFEEFKKAEIDEALGDRKEQLEKVAGTMCTAYGLALQGLGLDTIRSNLAPVANLRTALWKRKIPVFGVAAGIAVAASALMFFRPLTDSADAAGVREPPVISQAANRAARLRSEGRDAGVLSGSVTPNYLAANGLALKGDSAVYAQLMRDIPAMIDQARSRQDPAQPLFVLEKIDTTFAHPGVTLAPTLKPTPGGRQAEPDDPFGPSTPRLNTDDNTSRVYVRMTLKTADRNGDARVFETLLPWLEANATREGAPYIIKADRDWVIASWRPPVDPATTPSDPSQPTPSPRPTNPERQPEDRRPPSEGDPRNPGQPTRPADLPSLDVIAPLTPPASATPTPTGELAVHFYIVIGDDAQQGADPFDDDF